jgi:hypothetical protein
VSGRYGLAILVFVLFGCNRITSQDMIQVREAVFREFLPQVHDHLVFIAFDYHDTLGGTWDPPPPKFIERLTGVNDRITLFPLTEMERVPGPFCFRHRTSGQFGSVCWVTIVSSKGGEVTARVGYGNGVLAGSGYDAVMRRRKGHWVMIRRANGWIS